MKQGRLKYCLPFLFFFLMTGVIPAQGIICSAQDRNAFETRVGLMKAFSDEDPGTRMVSIGKTFLGLPYVVKTLEVGEKESLVINLHGMDCTTFVENVLAFSQLLGKGKADFDSYAGTLENIRYKDGKMDGYASRLHYFSEWIANNEKKGFLKDITSDIGGEELSKKIDFMSKHRDLYPFLSKTENYRKILQSEAYLNNQPICILPQALVPEKESLIASGDIIALTTSIEGLDITHTGIATREADGRIHLLHASSSGEVEVSDLPLADYLKNIHKNTGIMVARPVRPF